MLQKNLKQIENDWFEFINDKQQTKDNKINTVGRSRVEKKWFRLDE